MDIDISFYIPIGCLIACAVAGYLVGAVVCGRVAHGFELKNPTSMGSPPAELVFIFWPLFLVGFLLYFLVMKPLWFFVTVGQK